MRTKLYETPLLIRALISIAIGLIGFEYLVDNKAIGIMEVLLIIVFSIVFSYGVICLVKDYKKGGLRYLINRFFNQD